MMKRDNKDVNLVVILPTLKKEQWPVSAMELIDRLERVTILVDARLDLCTEKLMELFKKTKVAMKTVFHWCSIDAILMSKFFLQMEQPAYLLIALMNVETKRKGLDLNQQVFVHAKMKM